jgi:long-chain fatty acid transport protein
MEMNNAVRNLAAPVLMVCAPLSVQANGMRLVSQDAFAAARGEAFVATANNPAAIYYNPAGITQLEGDNLRAGATILYFDPTFRPPSDQRNSDTTYDIQNNEAIAPQVYYTHSWESSPVSAGVGLYAPYGASVTWPQDTGFRTLAVEGSLMYLRVNPVVALELAPGFSVAGGVMIDYSSLTQRQGIRPNSRRYDDYFQFRGDGWGLGFNFGLLWEINEKFSFGATFRSMTTVQYKGETEVVLPPIQRTPWTTGAQSEYNYPLTAVFGLSYRPTPRWNLEVNLDYTDWSSLDTVTLYQDEAPPARLPQTVPINLEWKASWMYEFGVTHYLENGWQFSAGYFFNQNSVPDDYYAPLVADLDRHFFSVGTGYHGEGWTFDIAYQFGYGPPRTVTDSVAPSRALQIFGGQNGDGTYEWISHAVLVSVGLEF